MKIYVTVTVSDWFEDRPIELDVKSFSFFTLECKSLLWTLHCWKGHHFTKYQLLESHELSPSQSINYLIDELDIRGIKSEFPASNRTIKSLFIAYKNKTL